MIILKTFLDSIFPYSKAIDIIWFERTDKGFCLTEKLSNSPPRARLDITRLSDRSSALDVRRRPLDISPILCPDLPTL